MRAYPAPPRSLVPWLWLVLLLAFPVAAHAAEFDVPANVATLAQAVSLAAQSPDQFNYINLTSSQIVLTSELDIGPNANNVGFDSSRRLVIRPKPGAPFLRAAILSDDITAGRAIIAISQCYYVVLQDLDILRRITNMGSIVTESFAGHVVIQRCRIGAISPPGAGNTAYLDVTYPEQGLTVRNCIFFSTYFGTCDYGIRAMLGDDSNELWLDNNDVADYKVSGIKITDGILNSLVVLRNNVVLNEDGVVPQPVAYESAVNDQPTLATSYNAAFAAATGVEMLDGVGDLSIAGQSAAGAFLRFDPSQGPAAFQTQAWSLAPGSTNPDFYRTLATGILHDDPSKWGLNLAPPSGNLDMPVTDDIQGYFRPGGSVPHSDRGPFQTDPGTAAAEVSGGQIEGPQLWARARRNPGTGLDLEYRAGEAGRLSLEVFDVAGRALHRESVWVQAPGSGELHWVSPARSSSLHYRLTLTGASGRTASVRGGAVVLR